MAGTMIEDYGMSLRSSATEGMLSEQRCLSGDSIAEWRSSEQVENGTASTSPPYWETDDDSDCGRKPLELYGRFTWKIESFSTINKKELRSNAFEVGGYEWYILIYPQGCDVCNHLSLFLCVANHDKLLPGWSHFAQFTITVVNKDPKKSKYSDTLHRFWKKEHDWGWKKFMELSKVYDDFIVADTLVIKAQVQVIREKADRPFRCLDCQYRRELVRVYLSSVEQICRRFLEERIGKLSKFTEDKVRWPSFCSFWIGIDSNARRRMSRDKTDAILKVVVKHFFIEKEVTSTLVMDSLYSGLKALEFQNMNMKGRDKLIELEELRAPMIHIDQDFFVLADDVMVLIERVVSDSLSHQPLPPKDDKCSQNRTEDGSSGDEFNKDAVERDEQRLMELGRKTIEIFVLVHIFSRIEVSYREAVALKRQEELIREEEAAGRAENELKSKRVTIEKEKRAKKKQGMVHGDNCTVIRLTSAVGEVTVQSDYLPRRASGRLRLAPSPIQLLKLLSSLILTKQKRNGRKGKEKVKDERCNPLLERFQYRSATEDMSSDTSAEQVKLVVEKNDSLENTSEVSGTGDAVAQPDFDERSSSPYWDIDTSEIHLVTETSGPDVRNNQSEKGQSVMDDSSSTCSTDSVPSPLLCGPLKDSSVPNNNIQSSPNRGKIQRNEKAHCKGLSNDGHYSQTETTPIGWRSHEVIANKDLQAKSELTVLSSKSEVQRHEKNNVEKEEFTTVRKKVTSKAQVDADRQSSSLGLARKAPANFQQPKQSVTTAAESASFKKPPSSSTVGTVKVTSTCSRLSSASSIQSEAKKNPNVPERISSPQQANATSRQSGAPLIPAPKPTIPIASTVQSVPSLSRSVSAAGQLGNDSSPSAPEFITQSYRNAIFGRSMNARGPVLIDDTTLTGQSVTFSHPPLSSVSKLPPQAPTRKNQPSIQPGLIFGCLKPEMVHTQQLTDDSYHGSSSMSSNSQRFGSVLTSDMGRLDIYGKLQKKHYPVEIASIIPSVQGTVAEEFPHLDIINDLLDDDQHNGRSARNSNYTFCRQYTFSGNLSTAEVGSVGDSDKSAKYFEEGFHGSYGAPINFSRVLGDEHFHPLGLSTYTNNQYNGFMQNQWPYQNVNPSTMFSVGDGDVNPLTMVVSTFENTSQEVVTDTCTAP